MAAREEEGFAVVGQGVDGSLANDLFTEKAVVTTSVDLVNRQGILVELSDAQALFAMPRADRGNQDEIATRAT